MNCLVFFFLFFSNGVSETALQNEIERKQHEQSESIQKHTHCTSFNILSAGFHVISALDIGV